MGMEITGNFNFRVKMTYYIYRKIKLNSDYITLANQTCLVKSILTVKRSQWNDINISSRSKNTSKDNYHHYDDKDNNNEDKKREGGVK